MEKPELSYQLLITIKAVHYLFPLLVLVYFCTASLISICTLQTVFSKSKHQHVRRDFILWLMVAVVLNYLLSGILIAFRTVIQEQWVAEQHEAVYIICSTIVWTFQLLVIAESQFPVWYPYYVSWAIAIVMEGFLLIASTLLKSPDDTLNIVAVLLQGLRLVTFILLPSSFIWIRNRNDILQDDDEERQSLLRKQLVPKPGSDDTENRNDYGSTENPSNDQESDCDEEDPYLKRNREAAEKVAKRLKDDGDWWTYVKGFSILFPYIWPIHSKRLQLRAVFVGVTLLTTNFLNVLVPRQLGIVTDSLVGETDGHPWIEVSIYAALNFAQSGACIGWIQFWLWQPLAQYSYDAVSTATHAHVMNLSSDFHEDKEASEVQQVTIQGRTITSLVDSVCFRLIPMFIDLVLVFSYIYWRFGPYMALIPAVTTLFYIYSTTKLASLAAMRRRQYITDYRGEWMVAHSSVENWRVASYHGNIAHEEQKYDACVKKHLKSERKYQIISRIIYVVQGLIMTLGLLFCCYLAVYQVLNKTRSPGDFVVIFTYWSQLKGPIQFFSSMYKDISESLMDAERLLELLQTKPSIIDADDAKPLKVKEGNISFKAVDFQYDSRKPTLKGVNFQVPGGSTVAIVGETGSGKSTILKLLDRFYDVTAGSVEIDGQDIRRVTIKSLRDTIGVVPQEALLFNDSIMNNVRYARLTAGNDEVYAACKAAAIHDKIMSFPNGYRSKVGSQGVKLSGGEQQRIAIARAILKRPQIILLDEATSAVDTETEQLIQEAFKTLCRGRTTLIVAHRLSTIMNADRILVVKDGEVIEDGSHEELIHSKGKYRDLWSKQIMVKPAVDSSRSRSRSIKPGKRDVAIINDVDPYRPQIELTKALRTTPHAEDGEDIESHRTIRSSQQASAPSSSGNADRESNAKLKPDAPEFIPHNMQKSTNNQKESSGKVESKQELRDRLKKEKEQKKSSTKKSCKKAGRKDEHSEAGKESTGDASQSAGAAASDALEDFILSGLDGKNNKPKTRRPRFGRRFQAKSEPANQLRDSMDGTQDSDANNVNLGEGQSSMGSVGRDHRRVSAPSDPPSSSVTVKSSVHGDHVRRSRHWRFRNKAADSSGSSPASGPDSSQSAFNDDCTLPNAPNTSPI